MPPDIIDTIFNIRAFFFESPTVGAMLLWIEIISVFLSIGLIIGIVVIMKKNQKLERRPGAAVRTPDDPIDTKIAVDLWVDIVKKAEKGTEQDLAFAIIEADKLVDSVLRSGGFPGATMAERLKRIDKRQLRSIEELWDAHKIRNKIVHDPGFKLDAEKAVELLRAYQRVLEELEVI